MMGYQEVPKEDVIADSGPVIKKEESDGGDSFMADTPPHAIPSFTAINAPTNTNQDGAHC